MNMVKKPSFISKFLKINMTLSRLEPSLPLLVHPILTPPLYLCATAALILRENI
jgi:hypothetical protein